MEQISKQDVPATVPTTVLQTLGNIFSLLSPWGQSSLSCMKYVPGYPLLGVLPQMCQPAGFYTSTLKQLFEAAEADGVSYAHIAITPLVYLRDPKIIRHVLVDSSTSLTRIDLDGKGPWGIAQRIAGDVLFTVEGEKRQRWHSGFLKTFNSTPSIQRIFPELVNIADRYVQKMRSPESDDLFRLLEHFTLDTAWLMALGIDHMSTRHDEFAPAFKEYSDIVGSPAHMWRHYVRNLAAGKKFTEPDAREQAVGEGFQDFIGKVLREHPDKVDPTKGGNLNILQQASKDSGGTSESPVTEDVMAQARQVLSLAHTPPALFLLWAVYELSYHPDKVQKLRQELAEAGWSKKDCDLAELNKLKYLDAIVNEIFRIHPPISAMIRMVTKPIVMQTENGKSITLEPYTYVTTSVHYLHHDHEIWGDNADEFCPERWLDLLPKAMENRCQYMPFLAGPKRCVASGFALAEVKLLLAMLYAELDIEILDRAEVQKNIDAVVSPENPIGFRARDIPGVSS